MHAASRLVQKRTKRTADGFRRQGMCTALLAAFLPALALALAGCATVPDGGPGWVCRGEARDGLHAATSTRLLDRQGDFRQDRTEWFREMGQDSVDARAEWTRVDLPERDSATYTFRIVTAAHPTDAGQVRVRSDRGEVGSAFGTGSIRVIRISGRQFAALRGTDGSLGIAAYNRRGELMGASGITWADLDRGLDLARQANARSLAASADYRRSCQREQRMTPA